MDVNRPGNGRMSRDLSLKIGSNQRIEIEMRKLQGDLTRPLTAKMDSAINIQLGVFEVRPSAQLHIFAMRLRQDRKAAHCFTVQHNIAEIDLAVDHRGIVGAGTS